MNYQSDPLSTLANDDDHEISLSEIFYRLWLQRGTLIIVPSLALLLAAVVIGFNSWATQSPVVYYIAVQHR